MESDHFRRLFLFVVKEILDRLHRWGVFEACSYIFSALLVIEGYVNQARDGEG